MATESEIGKPFYFSGKHVTDFIYEDEQCVVFEEHDKVSPEHFLVVPRKRIPRLCDASADDEKILGHLLITARMVAKTKGMAETGFRVVINEGSHAIQKYDQLCIQVCGGRQMGSFNNRGQGGSKSKAFALRWIYVTVDENHITRRFNSLQVFGRALHHMVWPIMPGSRI